MLNGYDMRTLEENVVAVYDILSDVYAKSPWSEKQILADMQQSNVDYFFVEVETQVVGFISVQQLVGELEITNIAVKKAIRDKVWERSSWLSSMRLIFRFFLR